MESSPLNLGPHLLAAAYMKDREEGHACSWTAGPHSSWPVHSFTGIRAYFFRIPKSFWLARLPGIAEKQWRRTFNINFSPSCAHTHTSALTPLNTDIQTHITPMCIHKIVIINLALLLLLFLLLSSSDLEVEAGGSEIQGHPQLHRKLNANLG